MVRHNQLMLISGILIIILAACASSRNEDCIELIVGVDSEFINSEITIDEWDNEEIEKETEKILSIDIHSHGTITVTPDNDIKIFFLGRNGWYQVANQTSYLGVTHQLVADTSEWPGGTVYIVRHEPYLPEHNKICIIVYGELASKGIRVAAYYEDGIDE